MKKSDKPAPPSYTAVFSEALIELAKNDPKIITVTGRRNPASLGAFVDIDYLEVK